MNWRNQHCKDIYDAVNKKTGGMADSILHPYSGPYWIQNMDIMAAWLKTYALKNVPITIVGDFDVDGICATAELYLGLTSLGATKIRLRIPHRMSEGYGVSADIIKEAKAGVLVTVDNGIAAIDAVKKAKEKGLVVLVIDHHMPVKAKNNKINLPDADLIVDPMVEDRLLCKGKLVQTTFRNYCAAGLVYKLCQQMQCDADVLDKISGLAAIATVADVMPLQGDNRNIFNHGINSIYQGKMTTGTAALVATLQSGNIVTASDIGYKIAPMLNAPGRLYDTGGEKSLMTILSANYEQARIMVDELKEINEERKRLRDEAIVRAEKMIADNCLLGNNPLVIVDSLTGEGIVGLVAGYLQEKYGVSSFVFTEKEGYLKGSARGIAADDMKRSLDELNGQFPEVLVQYGGHKGAAGLSVHKKQIDKFTKVMTGILSDYEAKAEILDYDLEITAGEIKNTCKALQKYVPFGQGNPEIVFCIRNFKLVPQNNVFYSVLKRETIRFCGAGCSAIAFSLLDKYKKEGYPVEMDLVGKLTYKYYMGSVTPQIEIIDLKAVPIKKQKSVLADQLTVALKNNKLA